MKFRSLSFAWSLLVVISAGLFVLWWRQGSDDAACFLYQRNIQQAVRSWSGMNNIGADGLTPLDKKAIIGPRRFIETEPVCPCGGTYTWATVHPAMGVLVVECRQHHRDPVLIKDW